MIEKKIEVKKKKEVNGSSSFVHVFSLVNFNIREVDCAGSDGS